MEEKIFFFKIKLCPKEKYVAWFFIIYLSITLRINIPISFSQEKL